MNHAKSYNSAHFRKSFKVLQHFLAIRWTTKNEILKQNRMKDLETENQENYTDLNRVITGIHAKMDNYHETILSRINNIFDEVSCLANQVKSIPHISENRKQQEVIKDARVLIEQYLDTNDKLSEQNKALEDQLKDSGPSYQPRNYTR